MTNLDILKTDQIQPLQLKLLPLFSLIFLQISLNWQSENTKLFNVYRQASVGVWKCVRLETFCQSAKCTCVALKAQNRLQPRVVSKREVLLGTQLSHNNSARRGAQNSSFSLGAGWQRERKYEPRLKNVCDKHTYTHAQSATFYVKQRSGCESEFALTRPFCDDCSRASR